jgi:hypothetical protein
MPRLGVKKMMKNLTYQEVKKITGGSSHNPIPTIMGITLFWVGGYTFISGLFNEFKMIEAVKFGVVGVAIGVIKEALNF